MRYFLNVCFLFVFIADDSSTDDNNNPKSYSFRQNNNYDVLYDGHIQLTPFQRVLLTAGSAAMCLYNPVRDGQYLLILQKLF